MANEENLKIIRTENEAREKGRKGGIASGKARREKKAIKDIVELVLQMPIKDGKKTSVDRIKSLASANGQNISVQEALVLKTTQKALQGDIKALRLLLEMAGQNPLQDGYGDETKENDGLIDSIEEAAKLWQCD
jgi:hypothetical protein